MTCAKTIQGMLRQGDIIARYGGEEFAIIIFPHVDVNIVDAAEGIRKAVSSMRFRYGVTVTVSIGVEKCRHHETVETLLDRADRRMYSAKKAGRNQVAAEEPYNVKVSLANTDML